MQRLSPLHSPVSSPRASRIGSPLASSRWHSSVGSPERLEDHGSLRSPDISLDEDGAFHYESKAQVLQFGITHRDPVMRQCAAEQLPDLCERRPVEQYVVDSFITLLEDPEWRVRRATIENLTNLCEPRDKNAVKAVIKCTWSDTSWMVRLFAVETLEKIGDRDDPQVKLALLGRCEDPEAARGGRYLVREAALAALLRLTALGESVKVVMGRLEGQPWAERKAAIQALMMAGHEIPCSTEDQRHWMAPVKQGFPLKLRPLHVDMRWPKAVSDPENEALLAINPENLELGNGFKPRTRQRAIMPMQTTVTWVPEGDGEWTQAVRFELEGNGFDLSYHSENYGLHFEQTAESSVRAQLATKYATEDRARAAGFHVPDDGQDEKRRRKGGKKTAFDQDLEEDAELDRALQERGRRVEGARPGKKDPRCTRVGEVPGTGLTRLPRRKFFPDNENSPGSKNRDGRKTVEMSRTARDNFSMSIGGAAATSSSSGLAGSKSVGRRLQLGDGDPSASAYGLRPPPPLDSSLASAIPAAEGEHPAEVEATGGVRWGGTEVRRMSESTREDSGGNSIPLFGASGGVPPQEGEIGVSAEDESSGVPPRGEGIVCVPLHPQLGGGEEGEKVVVSVGGGDEEEEGRERKEEERGGTERVERDDVEGEMASKTKEADNVASSPALTVDVVSSPALTVDVVSSPAAFTGEEYSSGGAQQESEANAPRPSTGVSSSGGSRTSSRAKLRGVIFDKVMRGTSLKPPASPPGVGVSRSSSPLNHSSRASSAHGAASSTRVSSPIAQPGSRGSSPMPGRAPSYQQFFNQSINKETGALSETFVNEEDAGEGNVGGGDVVGAAAAAAGDTAVVRVEGEGGLAGVGQDHGGEGGEGLSAAAAAAGEGGGGGGGGGESVEKGQMMDGGGGAGAGGRRDSKMSDGGGDVTTKKDAVWRIVAGVGKEGAHAHSRMEAQAQAAAVRELMPKMGTQADRQDVGGSLFESRRDGLLKGALLGAAMSGVGGVPGGAGPSLARMGTLGVKHHGSRKKWHVAASGARLISALGRPNGSVGVAASPSPGAEQQVMVDGPAPSGGGGGAAGGGKVGGSASLRGLEGGGSGGSLVGVGTEAGGGNFGFEAGSNRSGGSRIKDELGGGIGRRGSGSAPGAASRSTSATEQEGGDLGRRRSSDLGGKGGDFGRRNFSRGASSSSGRSRLAPASSGPTNLGHIRRQGSLLRLEESVSEHRKKSSLSLMAVAKSVVVSLSSSAKT